jgi:SSS family solute:Na+ symporter
MGTIDWIVIIGLFLITSSIVVYVRKARTIRDFAICSQKIPGPGYSMGIANKASSEGYIWLIIFFAFSLQTILVGYFIAPKLRRFSSAMTLADVMGIRYGKLVKLISGILSVAITAGFVGVIAKATGEMLSFLTGVPFIWALIISTGFFIL